MPRRSRRPSQLRFLAPLRWAALALVVTWAVGGIQDVVCGLMPKGAQCPAILPEWFGFAVVATVLLSAAASAHRYWLDFHKGEYYLDLEDPDWRNR
ncbi:MAG: hypothetical protein QM750_30140 [Rubrivivax sp.]